MQIRDNYTPSRTAYSYKNHQNVAAYLSFFILIYENIFSGIKPSNLFTFLKTSNYHSNTKHDLVRSQAAKFKLLVVLLTTTTMNVGNRWHSTAGPKISVMRDF